jgi:hypothetical protein
MYIVTNILRQNFSSISGLESIFEKIITSNFGVIFYIHLVITKNFHVGVHIHIVNYIPIDSCFCLPRFLVFYSLNILLDFDKILRHRLRNSGLMLGSIQCKAVKYNFNERNVCLLSNGMNYSVE